MSCSGMDERLNDYLDGRLSAGARREVETHLEGCPACVRDLDELRGLLALAKTLPTEEAPRRDLWSGIEQRITGGNVRTLARPAAPKVWFGSGWILQAAAAAVLVAATAGVTWYLVGRGGAPAPESGAGTALVAWTQVESEYDTAVQALQAALEARRGELSPEAVAVVEQNLKLINEAIATTRAALESDPANQELSGLYTAMYRQKLGLLQRAARMPLEI